MRKYAPSEVVAYINRALPSAKDDRPDYSFFVSRNIRATLLGLVEIADRVPEHLVIDTEALTDIISSVQAIRTVVREAETQDVRHDLQPTLGPASPGQLNPVALIRRAFERCPDDAPAPQVERLTFIKDVPFRRSLETDLDGVDRALAGREWKAATVLGGAVVEALLLWAVQQRPAEIRPAIQNAMNAGDLKKDPGPDPETWHLSDYVAVARELKILKPDSATQARLLTAFRNLIHPGRVARMGTACNRATALAAQAAIAFVIEDLR